MISWNLRAQCVIPNLSTMNHFKFNLQNWYILQVTAS